MNSTKQIQSVDLNTIKEVLGLRGKPLEQFSDDELNYYWFASSHKLLPAGLTNECVRALVKAGFFSSMPMMLSMQHLTMGNLSNLVRTDSIIGMIVQELYAMPECKSEKYQMDYSEIKSNWLSIQFGIYSIRLPLYLWWMVVPTVKKIIDGKDLYLNLYCIDGVPVISLGFGKYILSDPRQVVEFEMENSADPVVQCVDDFLSLGLVQGQFSYENKAIVLYQLVHLYDIDPTWRYAFVSPIRDRLVLAFEPGDTFLDSLWKCLQEDVPWVIKPAEHLRSSSVSLSGVKTDLVMYALNPTVFVDKLKGGF